MDSPKLPEPVAYFQRNDCGVLEQVMRGAAGHPQVRAMFTLEQLEAYAAAMYRQGMEDERYIVELLVAAGHVSQDKVDKAREIAAGLRLEAQGGKG